MKNHRKILAPICDEIKPAASSINVSTIHQFSNFLSPPFPIGYGVKGVAGDRGDIIFIWTITGSITCIDDENKTDSVHIAVYLAGQDVDKDGFSDQGEVPFFCIGPETFSAAKRVPQMPACVPPP